MAVLRVLNIGLVLDGPLIAEYRTALNARGREAAEEGVR